MYSLTFMANGKEQTITGEREALCHIADMVTDSLREISVLTDLDSGYVQHILPFGQYDLVEYWGSRWVIATVIPGTRIVTISRRFGEAWETRTVDAGDLTLWDESA